MRLAETRIPWRCKAGNNDLMLKLVKITLSTVNMDYEAKDGRRETDYKAVAPYSMRDDGAWTWAEVVGTERNGSNCLLTFQVFHQASLPNQAVVTSSLGAQYQVSSSSQT